jgi:hypothetical protein
MNPFHKIAFTGLIIFLLSCFAPLAHAQSETTSDAETWFKKADAVRVKGVILGLPQFSGQ